MIRGMCRFITAILPAGADTAALAAIAHRHKRARSPYAHPGLLAQLAADERGWLTTVGHCDCDTPLGRQRNSAAREHDDAAMKWRRKGWSEAKIARALQQRDDGERRRLDKQAAGGTTGLASWRALLEEALTEGSIDTFGLLIHQYTGKLDEAFLLQPPQSVALHEATDAFLSSMQEDTLYRFHRG